MKSLETKVNRSEPEKSGATNHAFCPAVLFGVAEFLGPLSVTPHLFALGEEETLATIFRFTDVSRTGSATYVLAGCPSAFGQQFALSVVPEVSWKASLNGVFEESLTGAS